MQVEQDYYDLLGVGRDASGEEIRRAFRRLARSLHPDVAPERAANGFHDVVAAYRVLSHPKRRSLYDRFGRRPSAPRVAPPAPPIELSLEWYEAERGAAKLVEFEERIPCAACAGRGVASGVTPAICIHCRGAGRLSKVTESASVRLLEVLACEPCGGRGHAPAPTCLECAGRGSRSHVRALRVRIPAGVRDGDQVQVEGVARRLRVGVVPRPRDSHAVLAFAGSALVCALALLLYLAMLHS